MSEAHHHHAHDHHGEHACHHGNHNATAQVTDPVCGMQVNPQSAAGSHQHSGVTYYFCSKHCLESFKADPHKYLAATNTAAHATPAAHGAPAGAQYTCPMHPEILRDAPGDCPICGMALVPVAGTGESDDSELRDLTRRLWIGIALSIPLAILAMSP